MYDTYDDGDLLFCLLPGRYTVQCMEIPYKQKYWRTLYLAVCSNIAVGEILNWQI